MPINNLTPAEFLNGAKLALESAGLWSWVIVGMVIALLMSVIDFLKP